MELKIKLTGTTPLVLHNNRCVNPCDPMTKQIKKFTQKGKKTDADHDEIARLEFQAGLYMTDDGPEIPAANIRKMMVEGGRKDKMGKQFESGLVVRKGAQIEYDGPRDVEGLWKKGFAWSTVVGNQRNSIIRTRPRFEEWSCTFSCSTEDDLLSRADVENAIAKAEIGVGICDGRSLGLGRFTAEIL